MQFRRDVWMWGALYAQQAEMIAASAPEVAPERAEWMPLGVFALTQETATAPVG